MRGCGYPAANLLRLLHLYLCQAGQRPAKDAGILAEKTD